MIAGVWAQLLLRPSMKVTLTEANSSSETSSDGTLTITKGPSSGVMLRVKVRTPQWRQKVC